ncbi:MAG: SBBP repeat-containing protein, partial [Planctomycetota bacterium]
AVLVALAVGVGCGGGGGSDGRIGTGSTTGTGTGTGTGGTGTTADAPTNLIASPISNTQIGLSWTDNSQVETGFRIERLNPVIRRWTAINTIAFPDITSWVDGGLTSNTSYSYRVVAIGTSGDLGTSNEATTTTQAGCDAIVQEGGANDDIFRGVSHHATPGLSYVAATTDAGLGGIASAGLTDAYVQAIDTSGSILWTEAVSSSGADSAAQTAVDNQGNIYLVGTSDNDVGAGNQGGRDAFIAKFDPSGAQLWIKGYGTGRDDFGVGVGVDSSGNPVMGGTSREFAGNQQDPYLVKFDANGNRQWVWTSGTGFYNEPFGDLAIDPNSGDIYCHGRSQAFMPGATQPTPNSNNNIAVGDIFVAKVNSAGVEQWMKQIGSPSGGSTVPGSGHDLAGGLVVDNQGNLYISGMAQGDADGVGSYLGPATSPIRQDWSQWGDAVIWKMDSSGQIVWTTQFGTAESDWAYDIALTDNGKIYVTGFTKGDMGSPTGHIGGVDQFVAAFSPAGTMEWVKQFGTTADDYGYTIATDGLKGLFTVGRSADDFDGVGSNTHAGGMDGVFMHFCD